MDYFYALIEDHEPEHDSLSFHGIFSSPDLALHVIGCTWLDSGTLGNGLETVSRNDERWTLRDRRGHIWWIDRMQMNGGISSCLTVTGECDFGMGPR